MERWWVPEGALDVGLVLGPHRRGTGDPTWRATHDGAFWRPSRPPDGPGTLRVSVRAGSVWGQAWGPGAEWLLEGLPALFGAEDDASGFSVRHAVLEDVARKHAGLRIGRTGRVMEALVPAVLEQKVVGREAWRARRGGVDPHGGAPPGRPPPGGRGLAVVAEPLRGARSGARARRDAGRAGDERVAGGAVLALASGRCRGRAGQDDRHGGLARRQAGGRRHQ